MTWACRGQDKSKLADEIEAQGEPRRAKLREEVERYEREVKEGIRHCKKRRLLTSETHSLEGKLRVGNFWPKDVYEAHFGKKIPPRQESTHIHAGKSMRGIMLGLTHPIVAGVIEVSSVSSNTVTIENDLPVEDKAVAGTYKSVARTLAPRPKEVKDDSGEGGAGNGLYIQARASAGKKKKRDSDDSDYDPLDDLWSGPVLTSLTSKAKQSKSDESTQASGPGGGSSSSGASKRSRMGYLPSNSPGGSPMVSSYAERRKRAAAEQSAKTAIVEGEGMITKLQDDQLLYVVTVNQLASIKKKVSAALSPEKIRLLTSGDDSLLADLAPSGPSSDGEKLLQELNSINAKLEGATSLVDALQSKDGNVQALADGIEMARASGMRIVGSLTSVLLSRALSQAASQLDPEQMLSILQWKAGGGLEGEVTISSLANTKGEADKLQEAVVMRRTLEIFRCADTNKESCVDDVVKAVLLFKHIVFVGEEFKVEFGCLTFLAEVLLECRSGAPIPTSRAAELKDVRKQLCDNKNHRLHKILFLLPAGRLLMAKIDELLLQYTKHAANLVALQKLHDNLDAVPLFVPKAGVDLRGALVVESKKAMKDYATALLDIDGKLPEAAKPECEQLLTACFKHLERNSERLWDHVLDRFQATLVETFGAANVALKIASGPSSASQDQEGKSKVATESLAKTAEALSTCKALGIHDILGPSHTKDLNAKIAHHKAVIEAVRDAFPFLLAKAANKTELDVRGSALRSLAEAIGATDIATKPWACGEFKAFRAHVKSVCQTSLGNKLNELTSAYSEFALQFGKFAMKKPPSATPAKSSISATPTSASSQEAIVAKEMQECRAFVEKHFVLEVVGEVTEMSAESAAGRLDTVISKFKDLVDIDFLIANGKLKSLTAGAIVLSQPILHLGQHVVKSRKHASMESSCDENFVAALVDIRAAGQFLSLTVQVKDGLHCSMSAQALPNFLRRAGLLIRVCQQELSTAAACVITKISDAFGLLLKGLESVKGSADVQRVLFMCAEGDFSQSRAAEILGLVNGQNGVKYYRHYKKTKKFIAAVKQCLAHAQHVAEQSQLDIKDALNTLTQLMEKEASESKGFRDTMGHLLCVQALFRTLPPDQTREDVVMKCKAGLATEVMEVCAPLCLAMNAVVAPSASVGEPSTAGSAV